MERKEFGKFIATCRKNNHMTQAQLAKKLHVTDKAVSRWENGYGYPDVNLMEPLADALGISIAELMQSKKSEMDTMTMAEANQAIQQTITLVDHQHTRKNKRYFLIVACIVLMIGINYYISNNKKIMIERNFENMSLYYEGFEGESLGA